MSRAISTSTSSRGALDPTAPGTIIRSVLVFESVTVIGIGGYLLFFPRHFLFSLMGSPVSQITPTALQLAQHFGITSILAGAAVACGIPNTKKGVEIRRPLYKGFLGFELAYVPLMLWQAFSAKGGLGKDELLKTVAFFLPFMSWRVFALGWRDEWFGRWKEGGRME